MERKQLILGALLCLIMPLALSGPVPDAAELRALATRYEHGEGVPRNRDRAFRLYCVAAGLGNRASQYNLGWMYLNGRGVRHNDGRAIGWLRRAARSGDSHAQGLLERLGSIEASADPACPMLSPGAPVARAAIETWVRILAGEYCVDPQLVISIIAVESNFDPRAHSPKNAQGLMQLLPATAKRFGAHDTWDPVRNLHGGIAYLRWLLTYFEGDVRLSLAAYNAGEHAVERYQGVPPYAETRRYVHRIVSMYGTPARVAPECTGTVKPLGGAVTRHARNAQRSSRWTLSAY